MTLMTGERKRIYVADMIDIKNYQTTSNGKLAAPPLSAGGQLFGVRPELIRLPKPRSLCPYTGLSRSKMNELVLPCAANNFKPPVKFISLRNRGQVKAVRLIVYDSLMAYLRSFLQDGGDMIIAILFAALAALALGHTSILEAQGLQGHPMVGCKLPSGNTMASQITDQNASVAVHGSVSVAGRGLIGLVPAMTLTKLGCAPNGIIASSLVSTAWDLRFTSLDKLNQPGTCLMFILVSQINGESNGAIVKMNNNKIVVKLAPTVVPAVSVVKKSVFAFKSRPEIAPKGFQEATYVSAINETPENGDAFNRVVKSVKLDAPNSKGNHWVLVKTYNLLGRGAAAFVEDYNAWSGADLTEDDLYGSFNGEKDKGKAMVVEVEHRKFGTEWAAYIKAFHPAGYTGEASEAEVTATGRLRQRSNWIARPAVAKCCRRPSFL